MTINDYADAISDALNADLRPGEPAWSVVRHRHLPTVLLIEQRIDPPHLFSVPFRRGCPSAQTVADTILTRTAARR